MIDLVRVQVALLKDGGSLLDAFHTPSTLCLQQEWEEELDWDAGAPGNFIPPEVVQSILDQLQEREAQLERSLHEQAALRIQKHFRGWRCRRLNAFNPHTDIGAWLLRLSFHK